MNHQALTESFQTIRAAIESARDQNDTASLLPNYNTGIQLCDNLIATVKSTTATLTYDELMGRFNYFVSDSLPWTDLLLATINRESKNIKKALRDD